MVKDNKIEMAKDPSFSTQVDLGIVNVAFESDSRLDNEKSSPGSTTNVVYNENTPPPPYPGKRVTEKDAVSLSKAVEAGESEPDAGERATWTNPIEFLMSCISMSVGLGNIWRFPFTAYENGGGAFLIPYIIVLLFIGKPLYFLEMSLGQFSSYGPVKIWQMIPLFKGVGFGQVMATWYIVTYYCCLMAITTFYFFASFQAELPWAKCDPEWATGNCFSGLHNETSELEFDISHMANLTSSSEEYFERNVLQKLPDIDSGIGTPEWRLTLCLLFSWICIFLTLIKGVASSGKVAYFTAIFPYVVLITLLIRGVTLDGAVDGILFFITPQWSKLLNIKVWYAAVTQCFFSLSVCFGSVIMMASYNGFRHPIYRDSMIISFMDTFTSILAGASIFAILGNLAHESGKDIEEVVKSGTGLAFVSYPDAVAKFVVPQLFSVLFFLMLFTLGIGSATALTGAVITVLCDEFPHWTRWKVTAIVSCCGFFLGLLYVTPGGQYMLDLVDYFGGGFIIFVLAIFEVMAISWIYGIKNILKDIEFMTGKRLGIYWSFSWGILIPVSLLVMFIYSVILYEPLKANGKYFPPSATISGWILTLITVAQVPIWGYIAIRKQKQGDTFWQKFRACLQFTDKWGPKNPKLRREWLAFREQETAPSWLDKQWRRLSKKESHTLNHSLPNTK